MPSPAAPPAQSSAPAASPAAAPATCATAPDHGCPPGGAQCAAAVAVPPPRMIVPQTGPRPVYKAPLRPAAPASGAGAPAGATMRPAPGRPVPGQPIFQRPRPGAPTESSATAAGRAPADASHAPVAHRLASARRWARSSASRAGRHRGRAAGLARRHAGLDSATFLVE